MRRVGCSKASTARKSCGGRRPRGGAGSIIDGERLLRGARPGTEIVVGAVARRMADAWRTCAALDVASRGASAQELVDVFA